MSTLACFGFGYCAEHYVTEFGGRFTRIVGTTRTPERATVLAAREFGGRKVEMLVFDGTTASAAAIAAARDAGALLISAAPTDSGDPVLGALEQTLLAAPPLRAIVVLSTVGVYGDHGGEWVDETSPADPTHERARARVAAEAAWQALGARRKIPIAVLRLAGIYGPGQNAMVNLRLGRARRVVKPGQVFNRIHVADIAQAIDAAFARGAEGVFNVADDEPAPPGDQIAFAAELLGMPPPPEIPFAEAQKTMTPFALSFYAESRRVRNERLKRVLGVTLRYPTYREGLRALHAQGDFTPAGTLARR